MDTSKHTDVKELHGEGLSLLRILAYALKNVASDIHLKVGRPPAIRIDYFQRGGGKALELWWQPPGEQLRPVPSGVLSPEMC